MARCPPKNSSRTMARRNRISRRFVPDLRRRGARREPKRRFILYCEGKNTEPAYFKAMQRTCSSTLISVEPHGGVGVPKTIATEAVACAKSDGLALQSRRRMHSFERMDQVWAVFDRDEHPDFQEAVMICERHGVQVARSNPCFELWLILHEQDYNRPNHRSKVQADLKAVRPEYDLRGAKTLNCDQLVVRVQEAERRAAVQLRNRELDGCPYGNPSTTVGKLTHAIRLANRLAQPQ